MTDSSIRDIATEVAVEDKAEAPAPSESQPAAPIEKKEEPEVVESFTEPVDPKSLEALTPQQLLEVKKNWEAAYTKKRQAERKEIEDYKAKVAELQQVKPQPQAQDQGQVKQLADEAQRQVELGNMSVPQYTDYIKTLMADEARRVAREEYQTLQKEAEEKALSTKAVDDFTNADPRLNEHNPNYDEKLRTEVQRELADLLDQHLADHDGSYQGFDAAAITKQIVQRRDADLDEVIKLRTQQSTQAAKMREAKLRKSEVRGTTSDSQKIGGNSIRSILSETLDGAA
jgi:hypothetical protein